MLLTASAGSAQEAPPILDLPAGAEIVLEAEPGLRVEAALGGGVLRPVDGPLPLPEDGVYWLAVASRDGAGNRSPVRWVRLRVDATAPELHLNLDPGITTTQGGRRWVMPQATIRLEARDDGHLTELGIRAWDPLDSRTRPEEAHLSPEPGPRGEAARLELTLPAEAGGYLKVEAWAVDAAGNQASTGLEDLWVGEIPPEAVPIPDAGDAP